MLVTEKNILKLLLILMMGFSNMVFSQEFYPMNIRHLFTDEEMEGTNSKIAILNEDYLSKKRFQKINDSLYVQPDSKEIVFLSTLKNQKTNRLTVNYLTTSNLNAFKKRLQDKEFKLEKVNENLYQMKFKDVNNQFLIDKDSLVGNTKFHHLKFILTYDKETQFGFSTNKYNFPKSKIYPFQNTIWYFTVDYSESTSYPDESEMKIKLTKEKTTNKIEFTDDVHYTITYTDTSNKTKICKGTYDNGSSIGFDYDFEGHEKTIKNKNGTSTKISEMRPLPPSYNTPAELNQAKNTLPYFQFIFSRSYDVIYNSENDINLIGIIHSGYPMTEAPPSLPPAKKKK
ncbi:hypothetical protein [Chryseobacterium aurantiacum]|uniref:hypothetical protein n=1 Tax=Chryseobacterium aurantiacum TaxID=2116499 RepID=UPI000D136341|nr:hypothetical protein [Chryseobacterium aurantiacum]